MNKMLINKKAILGIYFIIFGTLCFFQLFFNAAFSISMALCVFLLFVGGHLVILSFLNKIKNGFLFIWGSNLIFITLFALFWLIFHFPIKNSWPLVPLCSGISFLLYYFLISRKNTGIFISGIFITLLSAVLFFFSCGRFQNKEDSFQKFLFFLITFCLVFIGFCLLRSSLWDNSKRNDKNE